MLCRDEAGQPCAFRDLGPVRYRQLQRLVQTTHEHAWDLDPYRQRTFRVHAATRTIRLVWTTTERWPETSTEIMPAWAALEGPVSTIVRSATRRVGRPLSLVNAMLARLDPGQHIPVHVDVGPLFDLCHRFHVPILSHPGVRFQIGDGLVPMAPGRLYEVNNRWPHGVINAGDCPRVHLIFDMAGLP